MLQDFKGLNKRKNNSKLCSLINLNKYNKVKNILVIIYFLDFLKRYIKLLLFLDFLLKVKIKTPKFLHELYLNLLLYKSINLLFIDFKVPSSFRSSKNLFIFLNI